MNSFENLSGAQGGDMSPEASARLEREIQDEQSKHVINFRLLSKALAEVNETQLDDTQHPVFLEIKSTLEQAARLAAHA